MPGSCPGLPSEGWENKRLSGHLLRKPALHTWGFPTDWNTGCLSHRIINFIMEKELTSARLTSSYWCGNKTRKIKCLPQVMSLASGRLISVPGFSTCILDLFLLWHIKNPANVSPECSWHSCFESHPCSLQNTPLFNAISIIWIAAERKPQLGALLKSYNLPFYQEGYIPEPTICRQHQQ